MPATHWEEATRAELYVRSDLPTPATQCTTTIRERLEDLVASGALADAGVSSWAKRVPVDGDGVGSFERERHEAFTDWARDAGVRLTPFFDTRECYSTVTGDRQTELVMPAACLALYGGDDIVYVAPHADESGTVAIRDCLRTLADDERSETALPVTTAD